MPTRIHLVPSNGGFRICQRGDRGESAEREPKRGSGAEPPAGFRGIAPGGGSGEEAPRS